MSQTVQLFKKEDLGMVRILGDKDNPLFCLKDVCEILEHTTPAKIKDSIIKEFGDDLNQIHPIVDNLGRTQKATFITEPQLYFVLMRSDKPKAKPFRQWVINEVLPSIRKTGSYTVNNSSSIVNDLKSRELQLKRAEYLSKIAERYLNRCDGRYAQILDSYATKELTGEHILPLPERTEHYYTAEEVGKIVGISANKVGRIANLNHLKNEKYGKWFIDKAKHTNKEIEAFRYNQAGIDYIKQLLV